MQDLVSLGVKALVGGTLVVAFAMVAEMAKPKTFSGLFSAAPSIALASLLIVSLAKGPATASLQATGMLLGSAGMALYCLVGIFTVGRMHALAGSLAAFLAWFAVAGGLALAFLR
jgi:uncharacterized membrane protein (GlpM family)